MFLETIRQFLSFSPFSAELWIFGLTWLEGIKIAFLATTFLFLLFTCDQYIQQHNRMVSLINQIPGPPVSPWFPWLGHATLVLELDRCKFKYGTYALIYQMITSTSLIYPHEGICKMWIGLKPLVLLYSAENVEVILSRSTLIQKSSEYRFLGAWLGEGLITASSHAKWRLRRKLLTPAFHFRILSNFIPIINRHSNILVSKIRSDLLETQFDVVPIVTLCTLDIISETAMGVKLNLQNQQEKNDDTNNNEYVSSLNNIGRLFIIRLMRPWLWPTVAFNISSQGQLFKKSVKSTKNFTTKVINKQRNQWIRFLQQEKGNSDNDINESKFYFKSDNQLTFLDLLLQHHLVGKKLSLQDLREEVDTFMFAGHDTTSHAISWTLYMLGLYPKVQQKVYDEIIQIVQDINQLTFDDIKQLKYLDCVLKEVQRIYPTVPFIARELSEDTKIGKYLIPSGTTVGIFTHVLHRDPQMYPKPEHFIPERFENCAARHPYSFIPFSAGPRNCIGQKFAQIEQKIIITKLVYHYKLRSVEPRDKLVIVGEMILRSLNGLKMVFSQREKILNEHERQ